MKFILCNVHQRIIVQGKKKVKMFTFAYAVSLTVRLGAVTPSPLTVSLTVKYSFFGRLSLVVHSSYC